MSFELEGKLIVKSDTQQVSEKFKKREFVVETSKEVGDSVYTETVKFQLVQDKCALLEDYNLDEPIKVNFNIKGNKWEKDGNTSYFVNLDAWRLNKETITNPDTTSHLPKVEDVKEEEDENYGLPF